MFDKIGDALLFQLIVLLIQRHIRGECLNRGDEPDKYHLRIDAHFFDRTGVVVTREDAVLMQLLIQRLYRVQECPETPSEVFSRILEERRMNSRIAIHPEEGVLPLNSHAEARISRQEPAGNEVQATSEKQRHQGQQLSEYPILKVVPLLVCFAIVIVRAERIVKDEIVKPQTVPGLFGAHRSTDDFPVGVVQQAGNLTFRA